MGANYHNAGKVVAGGGAAAGTKFTCKRFGVLSLSGGFGDTSSQSRLTPRKMVHSFSHFLVGLAPSAGN